MRRHGFTLVEMLVSLALVLFIMVLLSQALTIGLQVFGQLKAIGEMEERLRMASTILRQDLKLDHFEGKRRLSDPSFWIQGPPREGFFHIEQLFPSTSDGLSSGGDPPSFIATTHSLHFSIKARGSQRQDFLSAKVLAPTSPLFLADTTFFNFTPDSRYQDMPGVYNSQWAEVAYFLYRDPTSGPLANGIPLYALYRRQRLAVPNNLKINWDPNLSVKVVNANDLNQKLNHDYASISCRRSKPLLPTDGAGFPDVLYFNNPTDLTVPERRFATNPQTQVNRAFSNFLPLQDPKTIPPQDNQTGADLLLTDVVSFTVRVLSPDLPNHGQDFSDLPPVNLPGQPRIFDTWSTVRDDTYNFEAQPPPSTIRITALEITLRVWDVRTQQARQVTIIQDM
ncbi:MAG TPA: prepilin-type N-terminal cleavage/methylation domain-containing protein [Gemmataceae bacterium]|nr:prepilin-type N-terminal cleavage/methylation domain-containing protein [Gemmataceae bacterium]